MLVNDQINNVETLETKKRFQSFFIERSLLFSEIIIILNKDYFFKEFYRNSFVFHSHLD